MQAPADRRRRSSRRRDHRDKASPSEFAQRLSAYHTLITRELLDILPAGGPKYLYDLVSSYPRRNGKGLRGALALAACRALGGSHRYAMNAAVLAELLHNAFLIYDDVQDGSLARRGAATIPHEHGIGIAVNVANAANLIALRRILEQRRVVGSETSWLVAQETERMMRHSLEGQAIELGWIRDNVCDLIPRDYLRMCLKKTSWYSFIYPLRIGALIAQGAQPANRFCRFGWYVGAAFQIQDDLLNLTGTFAKYGKEIFGDLVEGKRTLPLVHLLGVCTSKERRALEHFLGGPRRARERSDVRWVLELMQKRGSIAFARKAARQLAGGALFEALAALRDVPESEHKRFILEMVLFVVNRDR
jgi:geranylgeranyl diphosphate synthase type II